MIDVAALNAGITVDEGKGVEGRGYPTIHLPGATLWGRAHSGTKESGYKPFIKVCLDLDGDWPAELSFGEGHDALRVQISLEERVVFTGFESTPSGARYDTVQMVDGDGNPSVLLFVNDEETAFNEHVIDPGRSGGGCDWFDTVTEGLPLLPHTVRARVLAEATAAHEDTCTNECRLLGDKES